MTCDGACEANRTAALIAPQGFDRAVPITGHLACTVEAAQGGVVGPELAQLRRARRAFDGARFSDRVSQELKGRGRRVSFADLRSPQRFPRSPQIEHQLREVIAGADVGWPAVPGRVPPAGWDGEPGAHSPFREI